MSAYLAKANRTLLANSCVVTGIVAPLPERTPTVNESVASEMMANVLALTGVLATTPRSLRNHNAKTCELVSAQWDGDVGDEDDQESDTGLDGVAYDEMVAALKAGITPTELQAARQCLDKTMAKVDWPIDVSGAVMNLVKKGANATETSRKLAELATVLSASENVAMLSLRASPYDVLRQYVRSLLRCAGAIRLREYATRIEAEAKSVVVSVLSQSSIILSTQVVCDQRRILSRMLLIKREKLAPVTQEVQVKNIAPLLSGVSAVLRDAACADDIVSVLAGRPPATLAGCVVAAQPAETVASVGSGYVEVCGGVIPLSEAGAGHWMQDIPDFCQSVIKGEHIALQLPGVDSILTVGSDRSVSGPGGYSIKTPIQEVNVSCDIMAALSNVASLEVASTLRALLRTPVAPDCLRVYNVAGTHVYDVGARVSADGVEGTVVAARSGRVVVAHDNTAPVGRVILRMASGSGATPAAATTGIWMFGNKPSRPADVVVSDVISTAMLQLTIGKNIASLAARTDGDTLLVWMTYGRNQAGWNTIVKLDEDDR